MRFNEIQYEYEIQIRPTMTYKLSAINHYNAVDKVKEFAESSTLSDDRLETTNISSDTEIVRLERVAFSYDENYTKHIHQVETITDKEILNKL